MIYTHEQIFDTISVLYPLFYRAFSILTSRLNGASVLLPFPFWCEDEAVGAVDGGGEGSSK